MSPPLLTVQSLGDPVCVCVYVCVHCSLQIITSYWFCIVYANYEVGFLSFTSKYVYFK